MHTLLALLLISATGQASGRELDGMWMWQTRQYHGDERVEHPFCPIWWVFQEGAVCIDRRAHYKVVLDARANPKKIDLVTYEGKYWGVVAAGIYRIEGDRLLISMRGVQPGESPDEMRPRDFKLSRTGESLTTLRR